jgi:hypothetical protein
MKGKGKVPVYHLILKTRDLKSCLVDAIVNYEDMKEEGDETFTAKEWEALKNLVRVVYKQDRFYHELEQVLQDVANNTFLDTMKDVTKNADYATVLAMKQGENYTRSNRRNLTNLSGFPFGVKKTSSQSFIFGSDKQPIWKLDTDGVRTPANKAFSIDSPSHQTNSAFAPTNPSMNMNDKAWSFGLRDNWSPTNAQANPYYSKEFDQ